MPPPSTTTAAGDAGRLDDPKGCGNPGTPSSGHENDLDLPPSLPETIRAVQQIPSGKALGSDAIPTGSIQARQSPVDGRTHNTLPGDVAPRTSSSGF
ncbi:unnamed protein product [Schistocephalus solidus]|uniref:Uncharacterized protein n=1 Tax=Schistocephalus solidus TaxID=70667 RepID=A0A183SWL2_SCHSO|nr:unnamed protein product [Schistocephalus solidus]